MRKLPIIFMLAFFLFNCGNRINKKVELNNIDSLLNSEVGYEDSGQFIFSVTTLSLLKAYKMQPQITDLENENIDFKVEEIENKKYLRIYSDNNIISTNELIKNSKDIYKTGTTMCTSQINDDGQSCVPNGLYCSKLTTNENEFECLRTTAMGY